MDCAPLGMQQRYVHTRPVMVMCSFSFSLFAASRVLCLFLPYICICAWCFFSSPVGMDFVVSLLLAHGADPHQTEQFGWTALHLAAGGSPLPDSISRVFFTNRYRKIFSCLLSLGGHVAACRTLLDSGADATAIDRAGNAPLHLATAACAADAVAVLAARGPAAINKANAHGATPLRIAAQMCSAECVRALLRAGANAQTLEGLTLVGEVAAAVREYVVQLAG